MHRDKNNARARGMRRNWRRVRAASVRHRIGRGVEAGIGSMSAAGDLSKTQPIAARWLAYITTLPTEDPAARMRVLRTLESLGCAVMREGVFLLPDTPAARQGLNALTEHVRRINGSAYVLSVSSLDEAQTQQFLGFFDRTHKYNELIKTVESLKTAIGIADSVQIQRLLNKQKRDYETISTLDFFPSEAKDRAARALAEADKAVHTLMFPDAPKKADPLASTVKNYVRCVWATRKPLWADQLASAWLIRRFIDAQAKLLWLDKNQECPASAIGFAFAGAAFSNSKDKVTFEEILTSFKLDKNTALARIGALIHALNAGDTKMAEAAGVQTLLQGAVRRTESDDQLLAETEMTFDLLYEAYLETPGKA